MTRAHKALRRSSKSSSERRAMFVGKARRFSTKINFRNIPKTQKGEAMTLTKYAFSVDRQNIAARHACLLIETVSLNVHAASA